MIEMWYNKLPTIKLKKKKENEYNSENVPSGDSDDDIGR
jgi:hypothetical protein